MNEEAVAEFDWDHGFRSSHCIIGPSSIGQCANFLDLATVFMAQDQ